MVKSKASPLNSFLEVLAYSWPNWQPITPSGPLRLRYDLPGTECVEINLNQQTTSNYRSYIMNHLIYCLFQNCLPYHLPCFALSKPKPLSTFPFPRCLKVHQSLPQLLWIKARPLGGVFSARPDRIGEWGNYGFENVFNSFMYQGENQLLILGINSSHRKNRESLQWEYKPLLGVEIPSLKII